MYQSHWTVKINNNNKKLNLWALIMIDTATGSINMSAIKMKTANIIANKLEHTWLTKYHISTKVILDRGSDFMAEVISLLRDDYNITRNPITARNLQANVIVKHAHQTIGNIICTFQLDNT